MISRRFCFTLAILFAISPPVPAAPKDDKPKKKGDTTKREDKAPSVGDVAPAFTLSDLEKPKRKTKLESFRGKRPVILFFGSYT